MQYGFFDDQAREYVITTPRTPYPWINYLGCEDFYGLISQTAGGYCFYRDARLRRITRYRYNNVPLDANGRYFYINDGGDVWSPGWLPVKTELDAYECRHGFGYTRITGERGGVRASVLFTVPLGANCEVHRVTLRNTSSEAKNLTVFSCVEWCFWSALDDMTNFQRNFSCGEVEVEGSAVYHVMEYRERRNHFAFYSVNAPVDGTDTDRDAFVGPYNGYGDAAVPLSGRSANTASGGWAPIASHCLRVALAPGEERDFVFVLGYVENPEAEKWEAPGVVNKARARAMQERFATPAAVDEALGALREHWDRVLSAYRLEAPDERLRRMVNLWNPYQVMVTFNLSRSASYFESGIGRGIGFRDSNQDLLAFVQMEPERARARLLDLAATQLPDGGAYHQYQPLTKRGNDEIGSGFNDDPLWLIASTCAYVRETGDWAVLDEQVPFDNDPADAAPLFEHLRRSFRHVVENRGPHGLPLIGRADWNDCLNLNCYSTEPGASFQTSPQRGTGRAESVLIAGMFCAIGPDYAELCRRRGLADEAAECGRQLDEMRRAVLEHAWDGDWFLRAYGDVGQKVGGRECAEGQIYIEPQGYCVMAGIGVEDGRAERALDSVRERLETPHGIVLHQPAYTSYHPELGEISSYPPGYKENAGVFCHNNPWIVIAETVLGRGDRAFDLWRRFAPAYLEDRSDLHRLEPYVYAQMIAGPDSAREGEAKNSWLTGTAAWCYVAVTHHILGVRPEFDGLRVDPCVPAAWEGFTVERRWRGATYRIEVRNPDGVCKGVRSVEVDGRPIEGSLLPVFADGAVHAVSVRMG